MLGRSVLKSSLIFYH